MEPVQNVYEAAAFDLANLLDAGEGAVVLLEAGETRLLAHAAVLAARSPVFGAMFRHDTAEASSREVRIEDVEGPVLRQLLAYLYTSRAPHLQLPGMAGPLLAAADKYGVLDLKEECERQVRAQLSVETAAAAAVLAVRHSCPGLRQAAVAFIREHVFQVMATQGWAEAVRSQPEDMVEVHRLLAELHQKTKPRTDPGSQAEPRGDHSPTSATATPPTPDRHTAPPAQGVTSRQRAVPGSRSRTSPATQTEPHSDRGCTTAAPAAPRTAARRFRLRSRYTRLPAHEKVIRLIEAAKEGALGDVQALLAAGAEAGVGDGARQNALHWAAYEGHVEIVRCLLDRGADVDATDNLQRSPLHHAAWCGHTAVVRLLAAASADVNARDEDGWTPLHWAVTWGHAEAAAALLDAGADGDAPTNRGETPLDLARQQNDQPLVEVITRTLESQ